MRIFDRIAAGEQVFGYDDKPDGAEEMTALRRAANTFVRIVADEAAQYYYQSKKIEWSLGAGDFGPLIPAFCDMWIEWIVPNESYTKEDWDHDELLRTAVIVQSNQGINGDWHMIFGPVITYWPGVGMVRSGYSVAAIVDSEGRETSRHTGISRHIRRFGLLDEYADNEYEDYEIAMTHPAALAVGWMACKNTSLSDVNTPWRVARRRRKKKQPPSLSYKRIDVSAPKPKGYRYGKSDSSAKQRHHMVRGHFKTFTEDNKLFGRLTGTYWWQWQVRGDKSLGTINHEYHVSDEAAS